MGKHRLYLILAILIYGTGCERDPMSRAAIKSDIPDHFPEIIYPDDNAYSVARFELGKSLFYNPVLSRDSTLSCGSCHKLHLAFGDNTTTSPGVEGRNGSRNSPSLANVAYLPYFTREGGVPTLEMQVLVPFQEHNEFDFNIVDAAERLMQNDEYVSMSMKAYNRLPDAFVITRALACFERELISGESRYDQYVFGGDKSVMTRDEIAGMNLFFSDKTNCSTCHSGFNFTDNSFANNGLYAENADVGRMRLTGKQSDMGLFKVPTLRNISVTAPYMHDGSFNSLRQVVEHYNSGGNSHLNKDNNVKSLGLAKREIEALLAFLNTLTDDNFIRNENLSIQ